MAKIRIQIDHSRLKQLLKEAVIEALEEKKNILHDLIIEAMEDMALVHAIEEGEDTETISKQELRETSDYPINHYAPIFSPERYR